MSEVSTIPDLLIQKYENIISISDDICVKVISKEYASLVKNAAQALCLLPQSPLAKGTAKTWACGITHAIGMVNLLFDNAQQPYLSATELYSHFGVSRNSSLLKSKITRDRLGMSQMDPKWSTTDRICENPTTWLFEHNGKIFDIRNSPITLQRSMFEKGFIPFIPGDKLRT